MPHPPPNRKPKIENRKSSLSLAGIILAAGGSTRMGRPKQLLIYQGQTLLRRAADAALAAGLAPVIAVIGDDPTGDMRHELADLALHIIINPQWRGGIGTSIRAGMQSLLSAAPQQPPASAVRSSAPNLPSPGAAPARGPFAGVLLTLCDQPLITAAILRRLIDAFHTSGKSLAAASYDQTLGVPAIFAANHFPALLNLPDPSGAKSILLQHQADLQPVPLPEAATDIDDPQTYAALIHEP